MNLHVPQYAEQLVASHEGLRAPWGWLLQNCLIFLLPKERNKVKNETAY
jgi:hypothetical protein